MQDIVERLIYDPNVQLGINQKADVMSFDMSPEDASTEAETIINEIDTKIEEVLAGTGLFEINPETKKPYTQEERNELVDILEDNKETLLLKQANEGDLSVVRANIKAQLEANAKAIAIGTHAFSEEEYGKTIKIGSEYLQNAKNNVNNIGGLDIIMPTDSLPGLGGTTIESTRKFVNDSEVVMNSQLDILRNGLEKKKGIVLNNEELLEELLKIDNAEQFKILADDYNMGPDKFQETVTNILRTKTKRDLVDQRIAQAYKDAGYSTETDVEAEEKFLNNKFQATFGAGTQSITGKQMVNAINKLYSDQPDMGYEEALEKLNALQAIANTYDPTAIGNNNDEDNQKAKEAMAQL